MSISRFHLLTAVWTAASVLLWALGLAATWSWPQWVLLWLPGFLVTGLGVTFPQWRFFGPMLCQVRTSERVVALTFDDGPDPESTPALLDRLRDAGVRATFFCVGEKVARHPEIARRLVSEGHLVANHSHRHHPLTNLFSTRRLRRDLENAQQAIHAATGTTPTYFRPPMGLTNPRLFRVLRALSLEGVGWSARGFDQHTSDSEKIVRRILKQLTPGGIIALHDGRVETARLEAVVAMLLENLSARGYQCRRLDDLAEASRSQS